MFFNVGSGEVLVILLIALLVLGPDKLPDAMRQAGRMLGEVRKVSDGFRAEVRSAMDDPIEAAARERGAKAVSASMAESGVATGDDAGAVTPDASVDSDAVGGTVDSDSADDGHSKNNKSNKSDNSDTSDKSDTDSAKAPIRDADSPPVSFPEKRFPASSYPPVAEPAPSSPELTDESGADS